MSARRKRTWKQQVRHTLRDGARWTQGLPGPAGAAVRGAFGALPGSTPGKARLRRILADPAPGPAGQPPSQPADSRKDEGVSNTPAPVESVRPRVTRRRSPGGYGGYLHWADAGSTYSEREISTYLQMELAWLKQRLYDEPLAPSAPTGHEGEDEAAAARRVADYRELAEELLAPTARPHGPRHLVLVNQYPREGAEYGNGFVHRRIKYYLDAGIRVHVAVVRPDEEPRAEVYDGVPVLRGRGAEARQLLDSGEYTSVSSHFLDWYMWQQVRGSMGRHRLFSFMHGFESRRWVRTIRNYQSAEPLMNGIKDSVARQRFWREVLSDPRGPERFVFVSQWWRRGSQDDLELVFPARRSAVVHNVIDTQLFQYREKDPDQRFKILWIRSAANLNYASDQAIAALRLLRDTPWWERIEVRIIGDGKHFGAFGDDFGDDPNVTIEQRFASQQEIAELHRDYGVFLVPTRWDSQGVSRDEAMASGLVAVTNAACAVPEFVDDSCAVIAGPEDVGGLAAGMERLFRDPTLFTRLSRAGAERVHATTAPQHTVMKEMRLMGLLTGEDDE